MGACGCIEIQYKRKITKADGSAVLIGLYRSCRDCESGVAVQFYHCNPEYFDLYDVENIPEVTFWESGYAIIDIIQTSKIRSQMEEIIKGMEDCDGYEVDNDYAELLSEEAFPDLSAILDGRFLP